MSYPRAQMRRTRRIGFITTALGLVLAAGVAGPAMATGNGQLDKPQTISKADANTGGANGQCPGGAYCSTRNGSPSLNGNGKGVAKGRPGAGFVGKADNKNPQGQRPNCTDHNAGYECDTNHGVGRSNPAHTGCTVTPPKVTPPTVTPPKVTPPTVTPPKVTPPTVTPPAVTPPTVLGAVLEAPPVETPQVLGAVLEAPPVETPQVLGAVLDTPLMALQAASQTTHPLPTSAAAGQASTSDQLVIGGFAAFLALATGFVLRRRQDDA